MQYKIKITHSFAMKKMNMLKCAKMHEVTPSLAYNWYRSSDLVVMSPQSETMSSFCASACSSCIVAWGIDGEIRTHDLGTDLHHL